MLITDAAEIAGIERTRDGYLVASVRVSRSGIQTYQGAELGRPDLGVVKVYRPADEVFARGALASYSNRPVTLGHPVQGVSAATWRRDAVGHLDSEVARDGEFVRATMMVSDAAAIEAIDGGTREISMGYACEIEFTDGVTPDGEAYQAVQKRMRMNHAALVPRGRAGPQCRVGDAWVESDQQPPQKEPVSMADQTRAVMVDGVSYQMSDQGAQLLERVQRQLADAQAAMSAKDGEIAGLRTAHASALSAKDGELTAARQAVADAEAKLTPAALDAAVAARSGLLATARRVLGDSFDGSGKTDAEVRRAIVAQRLGDKMPSDPDAAFVDGAFRFIDLAGDAAPSRDPIRDTLRTPPVRDAAKPGTAEEAWRSSVQDMTNAWQTAGQQKAN